jgi:hypothetical protein
MRGLKLLRGVFLALVPGLGLTTKALDCPRSAGKVSDMIFVPNGFAEQTLKRSSVACRIAPAPLWSLPPAHRHHHVPMDRMWCSSNPSLGAWRSGTAWCASD